MPEKLLLTPEESAEVMSMGRTTIYALMKSGGIESVKIGRSRRIRRAAIDRYVEQLGAAEAVPDVSDQLTH